jgi:hypothetical protein
VATDDELYEIGSTAWVEADHSDEEPFAAERRALYEAGRQAAARDIRATPEFPGDLTLSMREHYARIAEGGN